jgi:glycosyltransferase involved in cell wall biosynthesis
VSLDNVTPHEPRPGDRLLNRYFLNSCDAFLAMSQAVLEDTQTYRPNAPIALQPHPVYDHFSPSPPKAQACGQLGLNPDLPVLLFFGFIRDYKGLDVLLEATALLEQPVQLVIAGEAYGSFDKYQALIEQHPQRERIFLFQDYISDAEVPVYFGAADACVLPYRSATQSGIAAIALQLGTPMISTRVGGLHEYISDGEDGLLVEPENPTALAAAIRGYVEQDLATRFRAVLPAKREAFSWKTYTEKLLSL